MKVKQNFKSLIYPLLALFLLVIAILSGQNILPAFADSTDYTITDTSNVLNDLQTDSNFDLEDYPIVEDDYKIQVIQVAESTSGKLYLYTYQPCQYYKPLVATSINMSLAEDLTDTMLYDLTLINSYDVFAKYFVEDINIRVNSNFVRYYNISSIYRAWDSDIDKPTGNDNTISEVSFEVGKLFKVEKVNGFLQYSCEKKDVVTITDKYVDFLRFYGGIDFWGALLSSGAKDIDAHYVAFDCDYDINELYEADVYYVSRSVKQTTTYELNLRTGKYEAKYKYSYGSRTDQYVYLTDGQTGIVSTAYLLWTENKEYSRIQSVSDFIINESLSDETIKNISGMQWVLRFAETSVKESTKNWGNTEYYTNYTEVTDVSILRLKFKSNGIVYNLGVVDNMQSGDDVPGNNALTWLDKLCLWLGKHTGIPASVWKKVISVGASILLVTLVVVILCIVFPVITPFVLQVLKFIGKAIWWLLKGIWWLISWPFKKIKEAIDNRRGG